MFKRILLLTLAVLLVAGTVYAQVPGYCQGPGTGDILGQKKYQDEPHKIFRMVRYVPVTWSGSATLSADALVIWSLTEDDGITITTSTTSGDSAVAGIMATLCLTPDVTGNTAAQDVGKDNWGWLQTYGLAQCNLAGGAGVTDHILHGAGEAIGTSAKAGEMCPFTGQSTDARSQGMAGFAFDAAAAGLDDVEVFITLD